MIEIGKLVNGRYKVIANIGSGGMANVFLAHDLILDRDVAIKILRFDFQNDQTAIRRFQLKWFIPISSVFTMWTKKAVCSIWLWNT